MIGIYNVEGSKAENKLCNLEYLCDTIIFTEEK